MRESKFSIWILLPVVLLLVLSASVGLQLFQDGSSYLLEILITGSAIRHDRWSVLLFQLPTIFLVKAFHRLEINPLFTLPMVRFVFNLNYGLTPFVSALLSWLVIRKRREEWFIWVALIILFVNLVNFSWVSELLISIQLACPLLLALLQNPKSKIFWILFVLLTPFLFFLHPLVITIYLVLAAASAYIAYRRSDYRRVAMLSMVLFLFAAAARGIYSFFTLSLYEASFATSGEIDDYFVISRLENILFVAAAMQVAVLVLLSQPIVHSKWRFVKAIPGLVSLEAYVLLLLAAKFLFGSNLLSLVMISCLGITACANTWRSQSKTLTEKTRLLYLACVFLAAAASSLLVAQYASAEKLFTLKMGSDLFVNLLIMCVAAIDSGREILPFERVLRFRLVLAVTTIFVCVIIAKSVMWYTAVHRLEVTLRQTTDTCLEVSSTDFRWLQNSPYTMINNWSLTSLALVVQDERPRKPLLAQNDCQVLDRSGMIQVDPWSIFSKEFLVPPLD